MTLRRRPGNPSASHLSKYLLLPLCWLLIFHSVAQPRCSRCSTEAFQDALGFFCSASNESVPYQFSALTFFLLLLFSSPTITRQANTGVRFNGFWGSLPVCHLLNSLVIVFHMLPWKRSNQALSVSLYPRPATRHALSRSLPFPVCLRLHVAFSVCQNRGAVWCMRTNLNFLREPPHTIKPIMLCTQKSYRKFSASRLALSIKPCAPSHRH